MLPIIAPGVVSGALLALVTSFDEAGIALFIAGSEERTLPRQMWSGVRETLTRPSRPSLGILSILDPVSRYVQWLQLWAERQKARIGG